MPSLCAMGTLGGRTKLAEGREAEIFAWDDGCVLRLLRDVEGRAQLEQESRAMLAAIDAGVRCPRPRGVVDVDDRPGLLIDRVDGLDGLDHVSKKPWKLWSLAREFGEQHALLCAAEAPPELPAVLDVLRRKAERADVSDRARARALEELETLPDGDRICHGDFHPGNLIWSDGVAFVIDWAGAARGDPTADHARTLLLMRAAALPPGAPRLLLATVKVARGALTQTYQRRYQALSHVDPALLARWELPVTVARVADGIEEEHETLDRLITVLLARR